MLQLEVLVCTIDDGIRNFFEHLISPVENVRYLVSWQQSDLYKQNCDISPWLNLRDDIRIVILKGKGLAANRNHALQHAQGDLLLFSDDDEQFRKEYFQTIIESFKDYPNADILTFQLIDNQGNPLKKYAKKSFLYQNRPKRTYISSLEIAIRKTSDIPMFDTRFGLGAEYLSCGEEEIFIHQAFKKGLHIRYLPAVIGETNRNTTGSQFFSCKKVRRSKGAVLYYIHGYLSALLRCLKFALTLNTPHRFSFFKDMYDGIQYIRRTQS